jgi:ubiquinol-cytochrome c reductase cytochrome c subunit
MVLGIALGTIGVGYAAFAPNSDAGVPSADVARGEQLYRNACIACHGANLEGVTGRGPSLLGVGEAAVYFQVATGRMPAAAQGPQEPRKPPRFTEDEANQIAAYVQSVGGGQQLPSGNLRGDGSNLGEGGELFRLNCAQCHNFAGKGGALSSGKHAPSLANSSDKVIYAAMLTGPENMPVFGDNQVTPEQKRAIINYVQTLKVTKDPGGMPLGRLGPVTEGIVIWVVGIGALMFIVLWIGAKS